LARNRVFLTDEGLTKLRKAYIVVVGCGGVGSHCASALARSGASHIRLIDFDQVSLSSLNRHAVATLADVGTPKVHCLRRRLQAITPWVEFDCRNQLFNEKDADVLLAGAEFVVDAIDNIDSKVSLLAYCHKHNIPVISSMGAGCKSDPTRIFVGDISTSTDDPLSRSTRRRLRALGVASGVTVVYSTEKPGKGKAELLPLPEEEFQKGRVGELAPMQDFRVRILPVLGTMPAVFGYTCANYVILRIAGYPIVSVEAKGREKMYDGILAQVQGSEEKIGRQTMDNVQGLKVPITVGDIGYLVEEVYKGRSAVSGIPTRLALVRWRKPETPTIDKSVPGQMASVLKLRELVCMTKEEALVHEKEVVRGSKTVEELYDPSIITYVEERIQEEIGYEKYR
jgi:tRNA A37 threonylcarbamoyladenosine dehydratase